MSKDTQPIQLSRRDFLRLTGLAAAGTLLTACVGDLDVTANGTVDGTPVARAGNVTWNLKNTLAGVPASEVVPAAETLTPLQATVRLYEHDSADKQTGAGVSADFTEADALAAQQAGNTLTFAMISIAAKNAKLASAVSFAEWDVTDSRQAYTEPSIMLVGENRWREDPDAGGERGTVVAIGLHDKSSQSLEVWPGMVCEDGVEPANDLPKVIYWPLLQK